MPALPARARYGPGIAAGILIASMLLPPVAAYALQYAYAQALQFLPKGGFYDMPTFLQDLIDRGLPTTCFPIHEYWLDIGRLEDLERANEYFDSENLE